MPFLCHYVVKQEMSKDVASKKDELKKLGKELDLTEQACNSLQQNLNEYCPDIRRQENQVKNLKNRYTSINSQLQERWEKSKDKIRHCCNQCTCVVVTYMYVFALGLLLCSKQSIKIRISRMPFSRWTSSWSICQIIRSNLRTEWQKLQARRMLRRWVEVFCFVIFILFTCINKTLMSVNKIAQVCFWLFFREW